jgi:transposase-like protein
VLHWTDRQCRAYLEQIRWPEGPVCPWCGGAEPYRIVRRSRTKNRVASLYKCRVCRRQFSVTVGTIFEGSKIPLRKWFAAIYPMCAFKRGIGAQQIQVQAKVTYKTAWSMCQRVRESIGGEDSMPSEEPAEEAGSGPDR